MRLQLFAAFLEYVTTGYSLEVVNSKYNMVLLHTKALRIALASHWTFRICYYLELLEVAYSKYNKRLSGLIQGLLRA